QGAIPSDARPLYVGVLARDAEPQEVIGRILERDRLFEVREGRGSFAGDDAVLLLVDPFHDHRNAMVFGTNPNGAEYDALITDESQAFNQDWRAVWRGAGPRGSGGGAAAVAVPLPSPPLPPPRRPPGVHLRRLPPPEDRGTL